jgi:hypothetical protein
MDEQTELLRKILETLTLIAEPHIAQREERLCAAIPEIVGKGKLKAKAIALMDGARSQSAICRESGIDTGGLSRLTKALRESGLIGSDDKPPKLTIGLPTGFWAEMEKEHAR